MTLRRRGSRTAVDGRPWWRAALARPEAMAGADLEPAAIAACLVAVAVIGLVEALVAPDVTLGAFLILAAGAGAWLLRAAAAWLVIAEAIAAPLVACAGGETLVAAQVKAAAVLITGITVRLCVVELQAAHAELRRRAEQVAQTNRSLERFTADAAHELRGPLAVISSEAELGLALPDVAEPVRDRLVAIQGEVARMSRLTSALLTLSKADAGVLDILGADVDVADLLAMCAARHEAEAAERGVALRIALPDTGIVHGDAELLGRLVENLLDNALRHAVGATAVELAARREEEGWVITVSDDGAGVSPGLAERLFGRFVRGDRTQAAHSGAGLGLSLCDAIARAHGGAVELLPSSSGARFACRLPACTA